MQANIKEKIVKYAKEKEEILSIFYIKSRNSSQEFVEIYTIVNEIIVSKMQDELIELFDNVILTNKKKNSFKIDKRDQQYTILEVFKADSVKIAEHIISEEFAEEFIKLLPNDIEFAYDKMGLKDSASGYRYAYNLPKQYEYEECIRNFFALSMETSFLLVQRDRIAASMKIQKLREQLYKMVDWYIIDKFSKTKNCGLDYENIENTLESDYKDLAFESFSGSELLDIYHSVFRACQLFRKLGLLEATNLGYKYLKREDVDTLKVLRSNYKKIESMNY